MTLLEELEEYLVAHNTELVDAPDPLYTKSKIKLRCKNCGTEYEISVAQLLRPHPARTYDTACPLCTSKLKFISRLVKTYGQNPYTFLSDFTGYDEPIKVKCNNCGYEWTAKSARILLSTTNLPEGAHPCAGCTKIRAKQAAIKDIKELEDKLTEKFGKCEYTFPHPEEYTGVYGKNPIHAICTRCGYEMYVTPSNLFLPSNGDHYCRGCNKRGIRQTKKDPLKNTKKSMTNQNTVSTNIIKKPSGLALTEIKNFIKTIYPGTTLYNDISTLSSGRIDIYMPELKVGFNVDALLSESEDKVGGKKVHLTLTEEAADAGINLYHIFDDEWYQKETIVKHKLESILKVNKPGQIYARLCKVEDCTATEKNDFFNKNHVQGLDKARIFKCLKYNNEIVAVMSFTVPRVCMGNHNIKEGEYELSRFATSKHVLGAFSKLFKAIIKEYPEIMKITTFADMRWSMKGSNVYIKNGFILDHVSSPNYFYFDSSKPADEVKRLHRFVFRKQELPLKFPDTFDPKLTEFQNMDKTSYKRVWDCGNLVYKYEVKR